VAAVERIVLVHGSVVGGRATWREQRRSVTEEAELVVLERPGFPPGPLEAVDFEPHAEWVAERLEEWPTRWSPSSRRSATHSA